MAIRQPKLPVLSPGGDPAKAIAELSRFLREFSMEVWLSGRSTARRLAAIEKRLDALERAPAGESAS